MVYIQYSIVYQKYSFRTFFPQTEFYGKLGRVFTECGYTCDKLNECQRGYFCEEGMALHDNGTCVPKNECQCLHGGVYYDAGDTNPSDCSK